MVVIKRGSNEGRNGLIEARRTPSREDYINAFAHYVAIGLVSPKGLAKDYSKMAEDIAKSHDLTEEERQRGFYRARGLAMNYSPEGVIRRYIGSLQSSQYPQPRD